MEMCDYKILHHNKHGYVVRCYKCNCLKVAFGTTAITLTRDQFYEFMDSMRSYYEAHKHMACRQHKSIQIPTITSSISLVYSADDLQQLVNLLDEAYLTLEVEQLMVDTRI